MDPFEETLKASYLTFLRLHGEFYKELPPWLHVSATETVAAIVQHGTELKIPAGLRFNPGKFREYNSTESYIWWIEPLLVVHSITKGAESPYPTRNVELFVWANLNINPETPYLAEIKCHSPLVHDTMIREIEKVEAFKALGRE